MFESEVAYMILDNNKAVIRDLEGITSLLNYDLKLEDSLEIQDMYFDTPQGFLRRQSINFRLRRTEKQLLVSLKLAPHQLSGRGVRRREIELPWSYRSLVRIANLLKFKPPLHQGPTFLGLEPLKVLRRMDLQPVQIRRTQRQVRSICRRYNPQNRPLAELDMDDVIFLGGPRILISQIEIESKTPGAVRSVQEIGGTIASLYPKCLKEWSYGKFVTGLAIRQLFDAGKLKRHMINGRLTATAFPLVEREIVSGKL